MLLLSEFSPVTKLRRDNFRTVQATARIGILVPLCVYACVPCTSRAIYACVYGWTRVCVSSRAWMRPTVLWVDTMVIPLLGLRLCIRSPSLFHVAPSVPPVLSCLVFLVHVRFVAQLTHTYLYTSKYMIAFSFPCRNSLLFQNKIL